MCETVWWGHQEVQSSVYIYMTWFSSKRQTKKLCRAFQCLPSRGLLKWRDVRQETSSSKEQNWGHCNACVNSIWNTSFLRLVPRSIRLCSPHPQQYLSLSNFKILRSRANKNQSRPQKTVPKTHGVTGAFIEGACMVERMEDAANLLYILNARLLSILHISNPYHEC